MSDSLIFLLCSECFQDEGLRLDAWRLGAEHSTECQNCQSSSGRKLDREGIKRLCYRYFVLGTMQRGLYGGAPALQVNETNKTGITASQWFKGDLRLLEDTIEVYVFHYGPRLWMLGEIEPLKELQDPKQRPIIVNRIVSEYPELSVDTSTVFYRLRIRPKNPAEIHEYDSPPSDRAEYGRLDSQALSVLYASQDIELCIHECRATAEDDMYVATMSATRPLRLLNLNHLLDEAHVTEFESLDLAVHMLFLAGKHSYDIIRDIATAARSAGFDGMIYPSYFSLLRTGGHPFETQFGLSNRRAATYLRHEGLSHYEQGKMIPNLALFGRPITEGLVEVKCVNRLSLKQVAYDCYFGPVGYS